MFEQFALSLSGFRDGDEGWSGIPARYGRRSFRLLARAARYRLAYVIQYRYRCAGRIRRHTIVKRNTDLLRQATGDATGTRACAPGACTPVPAPPLHVTPPVREPVKVVLIWTTHSGPFSEPRGFGRSFRGALVQSSDVPRPADGANAPRAGAVSLSAPGPQLQDRHGSFAAPPPCEPAYR